LNSQFSFIILTYNEEMHLPRLLQSIGSFKAPVFILDSGSTDSTLTIAQRYGATILTHAFENHPRQWDYALKNFDIQTSWVICLDADQVVTPGLGKYLTSFRDEDYTQVNGIYFNRKNFFKGKWIKHGGYSPFYLLKMMRYGIGYSDLNENMDHRFIAPGKTVIWKDGFILEENLKENNIRFWIEKHNRYSDLVAIEEVERMQQLRSQTIKPRFSGSPDERTARLKQLWWQLPRYLRPGLYFFYRIIFQLGILDGRTGIIFHFLQAFWFRLVVDIKIDEILQQQKITSNQLRSPDENVIETLD
jgi:glycosyltransferase involved in cell wall biosynthesis